MNIGSNSSISGFTLVEVLVATGLFGLLTAAVAVASMAFLKNAQQTNLRITRDQVVTQLRMTATNKKAVLTSLKKTDALGNFINAAFYNCVCGVGTCANMKQPFLPFTLYDAGGNIQSPAYFDASGSPCAPTNPQCRIRVTTTFFAQCQPDFSSASQNPPANCNGIPAEFVTILYSVDENPAFTDPKSIYLKALTGPTYIQVADIAPGACP